jgi:antagonist of KipI
MIKVLSAGILDTIQDHGRYGYASIGINPGGAMDSVATTVANFLCGNDLNEAVIEMHFPAPSLLFEQACLIAFSGADFGPHINDQPVPVNTPIVVPSNATLQFKKQKQGARTYLAVMGGFKINKWLNSYSTNLKANAGGLNGRQLQKGDELEIAQQIVHRTSEIVHLPWHSDVKQLYSHDKLHVTDGRELSWLSACDATILSNNSFTVTSQSDRMGYRLTGVAFENSVHDELVSSAVTKGTIQLLPTGQLIILTADHQTTGGYPRLAHIITADLPSLGQMNAGTHIHFERISFEEAEERLLAQHTHLLQLQNACNFRLNEWLAKNNIHRS